MEDLELVTEKLGLALRQSAAPMPRTNLFSEFPRMVCPLPLYLLR